jgi:hypothetical protein
MMKNNLSPAMLDMLRTLARRNKREAERHGTDNRFVEASDLVMDVAGGYESGLAWRIADRTYGALLRRGLVEHDATYDGLIAVSAAGVAALEAAAEEAGR